MLGDTPPAKADAGTGHAPPPLLNKPPGRFRRPPGQRASLAVEAPREEVRRSSALLLLLLLLADVLTVAGSRSMSPRADLDATLKDSKALSRSICVVWRQQGATRQPEEL